MAEKHTELLPCPFCGSTFVAQGASREMISVWCRCGAQGPSVPFPEINPEPSVAVHECFAAWNRRPPLIAQAPAMLEALQAFIAKIDTAVLVEKDLAMSPLADELRDALEVVAAATGEAP